MGSSLPFFPLPLPLFFPGLWPLPLPLWGKPPLSLPFSAPLLLPLSAPLALPGSLPLSVPRSMPLSLPAAIPLPFEVSVKMVRGGLPHGPAPIGDPLLWEAGPKTRSQEVPPPWGGDEKGGVEEPLAAGGSVTIVED